MPSVAHRSIIVAARVMRLAAVTTAVSTAGVSVPGTASAEPSDVSQAPEAGAARGTQPAWASAYARGQWSAAVELLETIPESSRTAWHWLHLARAREKRGQLVEAFAAYERLRDIGADEPNAPGMKEVMQRASVESAGLAGRIPWADVALGWPLPAGALVFVDQQWLEPARLRSPYPVNPGWHTFLVESNGSILSARRVFFEEGQSRLVPLDSMSNGAPPPPSSAPLAAKPAAASTPQAPRAAAPSGAAEPAARSLTWRASDGTPLDDGQHDGLRTAAYVSLGIGGLATLIGTGLAISALSTREDADAAPVPCFGFGSGGCDSGTPANERWRSEANAAAVSYTVGLIGLVTGGVLWLAQREYTSQPTWKIAQVEIEPRVHANGAALHGRF